LLAELPEAQQLAVVRLGREYQTWGLAERACEESIVQASRDVGRSAALARLALEIAVRVEGPDGWRNRVQGFATAHISNSLRVSGELKAADATFEEANRLWQSGSDPDEVLDPGRLLDLEASLRRDQRRFGEALARLEEALRIGRCQGRYLINQGFTLEVMGEYERAIETLLQADPLIDRKVQPRLWYKQRFNLAVNYTHLGGRYSEAAELAQQVRALATELGDEVFLLRVTWLEGRIAAGLGRREEARSLLAQARREFAARDMDYDVALALLEEAVLLLETSRTTEVRELTAGLAKVFESKGVHREALAALQLFQEAAERENATAELARRVLAFLFRARNDQGLQFTDV
jgi:tetratricopeptide (TPR) repeat protein